MGPPSKLASTSRPVQPTTNHHDICSSYTHIGRFDPRDQAQCASPMSSGQVVEYWTLGNGTYVSTRSTVASAIKVAGIPIYGWMFDSAAATRGQCASGGIGSSSPPVTTTGISPTTAKALLGVGIAMLVLGLAIALAGLLLFRKARREKAMAVGGGTAPQGPNVGQVRHAHDPSKVSSPPPWEAGAYGYAMSPPQELAVASSSQSPSSPK